MKKILKRLLAYTLILGELTQVVGVYALTKDESVYAKLESDGKINNVIASEHLYNYTSKQITDKTGLLDIKSLNSGSTFKQNGSNLVWESDGTDIYYQGTYDKELPVSVEVKYYLDGKEEQVSDILGKKGKVKIVLNYKNNYSRVYNINGKREQIYMPYMIVTTSIINNADNKNIKVNNGRIVDNGVSSIVIALSSPGLSQSLNIDALKGLDKVEISFETDKFELEPIYSVATTDMFDDEKLNVFDKVNDLYRSIDELQSNMDKIVSASSALSDGTLQIDGGITELNNNLKALVKKYNDYKNAGTNTLRDKLESIAKKNIPKIANFLADDITRETSSILKSHKAELQEAMIASLKKNTALVVQEELESIINNLDINKIISDIIKKDINNLLINDNEVISLTNVLKNGVNAKLADIIDVEFEKIEINSNVSEEYIESLANEYGVTYEQALGIANKVKNDTVNSIKNNISDAKLADKIIDKLNSEDYLKMLIKAYIKDLNDKIKEYLNNEELIGNYESQIKEEIIAKLESELANHDINITKEIKAYIDGVVDKIIDKTIGDLADTYTEEYTNEAVKNIIEEKFGEENIEETMSELFDLYEDDINSYIEVLDNTIDTLTISMDKLNNGSTLVANGMKELYNGLDKFNKLGINKISNLVSGDVKSTEKRIESIIDLSRKYGLLDDKEKSTTGKSKIIFMIDSMSSNANNSNNDRNKNAAVPKKTLWEKIKGLFS